MATKETVVLVSHGGPTQYALRALSGQKPKGSTVGLCGGFRKLGFVKEKRFRVTGMLGCFLSLFSLGWLSSGSPHVSIHYLVSRQAQGFSG